MNRKKQKNKERRKKARAKYLKKERARYIKQQIATIMGWWYVSENAPLIKTQTESELLPFFLDKDPRVREAAKWQEKWILEGHKHPSEAGDIGTE